MLKIIFVIKYSIYNNYTNIYKTNYTNTTAIQIYVKDININIKIQNNKKHIII